MTHVYHLEQRIDSSKGLELFMNYYVGNIQTHTNPLLSSLPSWAWVRTETRGLPAHKQAEEPAGSSRQEGARAEVGASEEPRASTPRLGILAAGSLPGTIPSHELPLDTSQVSATR